VGTTGDSPTRDLDPEGQTGGMSIDSGSGWYVDPEGQPVSAEDDDTYDEAVGPAGPHEDAGRLVEDDEGVREDEEADAVARDSGDAEDLSAEEAAVHLIDE
jgi:hypothetical protein